MEIISRLFEIQMLLVFVCVFGFLMGKGVMLLTGKLLTFSQVIIIILVAIAGAILISLGIQFVNLIV
jgi:hypothetical protein